MDRWGVDENIERMVDNLVSKKAKNSASAPMAGSTAIIERGPWRAGNNRKDYFVESDDFTHDVRLVITGDFESDEQRMDYAKEIARRLNAVGRITQIYAAHSVSVP